MNYMYRQQWREKWVSLQEVAEWTREGKYQMRVEAARGLRDIRMAGGMMSGPVVEMELPTIQPAIGKGAAYTGLVLPSTSTSTTRYRRRRRPS